MVASHRVRALLRAGEPSLFLVCVFLLTLLLARSLFLQSDEGYTLNAAWQVWTGLRMYDDFRLVVGPGSGYAIYWAWRLWGNPSLLVARLVALAFSFWSTTGFYLLLRRLGVRGANLATAVIVWLCASSLYVFLNHNSFSAFAAIWFMLALIRVVQARSTGAAVGDRSRDHALVGAAAGVVFLFLPIKASLLAAAAAAFLFATGRPPRLRRLLALAAGFALVIAPLCLIWSPATLIRQWLIIPLTGNYRYFGHTSGSPYVAVAIVVVAAMAWVALRLHDRVLQALTAVQIALFLGMSHNMESAHFAINAFPIVVFTSVVLHRRFSRSLLEEGVGALLVTGGVTMALIVWTVASSAGAEFFSASTLSVDLLGHRPQAFTSPRIAAARAIYAGPFLPGLYYLLGKKNPFFVSETVVCDEACHRQLIAELGAVRPELVFLDYAMVRPLSYDENAPVDAYLRAHYVACPGHGEMTIRAADARFCP
ncbi:MAG TPA: hypothetical protein VI456_04800 [Polyangia bacterium]